MSKKKLVGVVLLALLVVGGAIWGSMRLLKKDWSDRQAEFTAAMSQMAVEAGAPSIEVADKVAKCIADNLIPAAVAAGCEAEGEDVLAAMGQCIKAHEEVEQVWFLGIMACAQLILQ